MNPITQYKWEKRVLIFSAQSPTNIGYKKQEQSLKREKRGMKDRDLIIYRLYNDHWLDHQMKPISEAEAESIRHAYNISENEFSVILVGKDGGVKMRKNDIVSTKELFALIDSMPMRKREMKEQDGSQY
ncbi:DUF4174 domain-containing protein [Ekhidna sp.]